MASTSKTPSKESLRNDEEEEIPSEEKSLTDLKFKIKPFNKKRPIFDPEIMGVKKKRGGPLTPVRSNSSSNIQKGIGETRSKLSLWSSSKKSNPKKETESEEDSSSSLNPVKNTLKGVERYMGCLSTRIKKGLYGGPSGPWKKQTRHVIPTKIVKQDFETIMTPEAKEIIETMRRLTRPIRKGAGWMSLREAESAPLPKPGSLHGPPVSWTSTNAWNKQKVGITNMDQLRENASESASTMSLPSSTSGGGGKVRAAKKTRERAPKAQPPSEEIESESCLESLASVPKLSFNPANFPRPVDCSTPQHKPKKVISSGNLNISRELKYDKPAVKANSQPVKSRTSKIPTAPREYIDPQDHSKPLLFSCPKYKESSSSSAESQTFDSQTSFSFSQPKKLNRLGLGDSQKKSQKDGKVSVKGYYEQKKKFLGSEEKKVEAKKEDVKEKPKSLDKKDPPKEATKPAESVAPAAGGFGDFMAKQKEASKNKWVCDICMMSNDASLAKCPACEAPNPKMAPPKPAETATPIPAPVAGGFADFMSKAKKATSGNWTCSICMMSNAADLAKCPACEAPNPNAPKVSSEAAPAAAAPKFSFGTSSATPSSDAPKPSFTFGASSTTEKKEEKTAPPTFSFGAPSTTDKKDEKAAAPTFSFGAPKTEETKTATPSFSFGSKAEEPKKDAAAPSFSFGATSAPTPSTSAQSVPTTTAAPTFSFGGGSKVAEEPKAAAPSFSFGGAKTEEKKADPAPTFSFGSSSKKEEAPKVAAPSFSFGGSTAPKTDAPPSFSFGGSSKPTESAKPVVSAAPTFSFGGGSSSTTTPAAPTFSFNAAPKPAEPAKQESSAPSFSFGGSSKPTPAATTAPNFSLGGATSATAEKPFTFGGASNTGSTQSKPAAPTFNFGGSSSTENKPFAFGGNTDKPASTAAAAPSFNFGGSQTNNSSKSTGSSLFGETQSSTNATPSFTFKGSSEPSSQSSMFGGASKPAPSFNFGGSSSTQSNDKPFSFGGSQPQAQEKPFSFGGASSQNTGGSSSMFSPEQPTKQASAPSFNFGGGGSQPSSQTNMFGGNSNSQSSGFNFGGDNKSAAPSGGNMFGNTSASAAPAPTFNFGGAGSQNTSQSSGFNFGGNASQPAPAGNMFSAGSQPASNNGVAAPRRKIVRARRNKR